MADRIAMTFGDLQGQSTTARNSRRKNMEVKMSGHLLVSDYKTMTIQRLLTTW